MKSIFRQTDIPHVVTILGFSGAYILREINFEDSKSSKTTIFCHFRGSEFCQFGKLQSSNSAKIHKIKIQSHSMYQIDSFCTSRIPNIDFT